MPITRARACQHNLGRRRRESIFSRSRSKERTVAGLLERRATKRWGKLTPSFQVAAKIRGPNDWSWSLGWKSAHTSLSSSPWNRQSLRPPPRLHPADEDLSAGAPVLTGFSLATPSAPDCANRPGRATTGVLGALDAGGSGFFAPWRARFCGSGLRPNAVFTWSGYKRGNRYELPDRMATKSSKKSPAADSEERLSRATGASRWTGCSALPDQRARGWVRS